MSAIPPKADIGITHQQVRYGPKADKLRRSKKRLTRSPRAREQRWRNRQAERLGRVEVEDHLDFRGLVHRQIGGLFAREVARIANHFRAPELDRIDLHDRQRTWHRKDPRESEVRLR